jgi:hypothetical protein
LYDLLGPQIGLLGLTLCSLTSVSSSGRPSAFVLHSSYRCLGLLQAAAAFALPRKYQPTINNGVRYVMHVDECHRRRSGASAGPPVTHLVHGLFHTRSKPLPTLRLVFGCDRTFRGPPREFIPPDPHAINHGDLSRGHRDLSASLVQQPRKEQKLPLKN